VVMMSDDDDSDDTVAHVDESSSILDAFVGQ
jgi:hypothetical protein